MSDGARHSTPTGQIAIFGAALDTGNLGVSALGIAAMTAIAERRPHTELVCFDNGVGRRSVRVGGPSGPMATLRGAWFSRRVYRTESLISMDAASRTVGWLNANIRELDRCQAVLDVSGGDSFSDLYGKKRFDQITLPKLIALRRRHPLYLLPQTFGPFASQRARSTARFIVQEAAQSWARDPASYEQLTQLAGESFDPLRHRLGVDVAFGLEACPPSPPANVAPWLDSDDPVVGVNISGLLANDPDAARNRFGLRTDQDAAFLELVERWLDQGVRVVLVPHVRGDSWESDDHAASRMITRLGAPPGLSILPSGLGASETKWHISQLSWFVGARMHATIAALSSGVPVAGIAYSDKIRGIFEPCGVADQVVDARAETTGSFVDAVWSSWTVREQTQAVLADTAPPLVERARAQFDDILGSITEAGSV